MLRKYARLSAGLFVFAAVANAGIAMWHVRNGEITGATYIAQGCSEFDLEQARRLVPDVVEPAPSSATSDADCTYGAPATGDRATLVYLSRGDVGFDLGPALAKRRAKATASGGLVVAVDHLGDGAWAAASMALDGRHRIVVEWADPDSVWSLDVTRVSDRRASEEIADATAVAREVRRRMGLSESDR